MVRLQQKLGSSPVRVNLDHILKAVYIHLFAEPGYYEDGNFGIRLENVLVVNDAETEFNFGDKGYLQFEHITWVLTRCLLTNTVVLISTCTSE